MTATPALNHWFYKDIAPEFTAVCLQFIATPAFAQNKSMTATPAFDHWFYKDMVPLFT